MFSYNGFTQLFRLKLYFDISLTSTILCTSKWLNWMSKKKLSTFFCVFFLIFNLFSLSLLLCLTWNLSLLIHSPINSFPLFSFFSTLCMILYLSNIWMYLILYSYRLERILINYQQLRYTQYIYKCVYVCACACMCTWGHPERTICSVSVRKQVLLLLFVLF